MREEGAADIGNFRVNICIPESFFEVKVAAFLPTWSFLVATLSSLHKAVKLFNLGNCNKLALLLLNSVQVSCSLILRRNYLSALS